MLRRRRRSWKAPAIAGLVVLALVVAAFTLGPRGDPALFPPAPGAPAVEVYVVDNGFHSQLVVPTARLAAHGGLSAKALTGLPPSPFVAVGWGDARFYVETGFSWARALDGLRALFAPNNPSVVMFEPLRASPDRLYDSGVLSLRLSPAGFDRMAARLDRSLVMDAAGSPVAGPARGWGAARFFKSGERFHIFHLCNHWTAELLAAAGVPVRPGLSTVAAGLAFDLRTGAGATPAALDRRPSPQ